MCIMRTYVNVYGLHNINCVSDKYRCLLCGRAGTPSGGKPQGFRPPFEYGTPSRMLGLHAASYKVCKALPAPERRPVCQDRGSSQTAV